MHNSQQENPPQPPQYQESTTYETLQEPTTNNGPTRYKLANTQVLVHGAMHVVIGLIAVIFNAVLLSIDYFSGCDERYCGVSSQFGAGFWCGVFFIVTGGFGIGASKCKTACPILTYMVLCIINTLMAVIMFGFGCGFITDTIYSYGWYGYDYGYYPDYEGDYYRHPRTTPNYPVSMNDYTNTYQALGSLTLIMSVIELVISIWSSALCCAAVCCCAHTNENTQQHQVVYSCGNNYGNNPAGIVYPTQASGMFYPQTQTTYIQGGAPVNIRPQLQPVYTLTPPEPPAYTGLNDVPQPVYDGEPVNSKSPLPN